MPQETFLLDTNCLIWFQEGSTKIPSQVLKAIENKSNIIYFSQISLFEIAIKLKTGKLPQFLVNADVVFQAAISDGFQFLPIHNRHILNYQNVPLLIDHRDPFDRLLIATANDENMVIYLPIKSYLNIPIW